MPSDIREFFLRGNNNSEETTTMTTTSEEASTPRRRKSIGGEKRPDPSSKSVREDETSGEEPDGSGRSTPNGEPHGSSGGGGGQNEVGGDDDEDDDEDDADEDGEDDKLHEVERFVRSPTPKSGRQEERTWEPAENGKGGDERSDSPSISLGATTATAEDGERRRTRPRGTDDDGGPPRKRLRAGGGGRRNRYEEKMAVALAGGEEKVADVALNADDGDGDDDGDRKPPSTGADEAAAAAATEPEPPKRRVYADPTVQAYVDALPSDAARERYERSRAAFSDRPDVNMEDLSRALAEVGPPYFGLQAVQSKLDECEERRGGWKPEDPNEFRPVVGMMMREMFDGEYFEGRVVDGPEEVQDKDGELVEVWHVQWEDGDEGDYEIDELYRMWPGCARAPIPAEGRPLAALELFCGECVVFCFKGDGGIVFSPLLSLEIELLLTISSSWF
jgi:hypothetical protein